MLCYFLLFYSHAMIAHVQVAQRFGKDDGKILQISCCRVCAASVIGNGPNKFIATLILILQSKQDFNNWNVFHWNFSAFSRPNFLKTFHYRRPLTKVRNKFFGFFRQKKAKTHKISVTYKINKEKITNVWVNLERKNCMIHKKTFFLSRVFLVSFDTWEKFCEKIKKFFCTQKILFIFHKIFQFFSNFNKKIKEPNFQNERIQTGPRWWRSLVHRKFAWVHDSFLFKNFA